MELKNKLSQLRKEKGLTQLDLAEALNVSRQAVSRWEVGTAVPTLDNLVSLSEVYGVSLDYLVRDHMEKPQEAVEGAVCPKTRHRSLAGRTALALYLIAAGALIATAAWKLYQNNQVWKIWERMEVVDIDCVRIITDDPEQFQNNPDEPRSYRMKPDGTFEEYSLIDSYRSLQDQLDQITNWNLSVKSF